MKHYFNLFSAALCLTLLFVGCEAEEPINVVEPDSKIPTVDEVSSPNKSQETGLSNYFVEKFRSAIVSTYTIAYVSRNVTGTGEGTITTFNYKVTGGGSTPQLDSFSLELPGCSGDLLSYSPQQPTKVSGNLITWNNSVSKDGFQEFSVTFRGNVGLGLVSTTVTRGSLSETKDIIGPCNGVYTLAGSIFINANEDEDKQTFESGIPNIPIDLLDENGILIKTLYTSANGTYSFKVLKGNYTISVNETLMGDDNYTAVENSFLNPKNVQANVSDLNFGYSVNTSKIIKELDERTIRVNTEPTKFWVQQIRNAGKKGSLYSKEDIRNLLIEVEGMFLEVPFQFGLDKEARALSILTNPIRSDTDEFLQQLLTAELNIASDRGAYDPATNTLNYGFNNALLIYSEAVACSEFGSCPPETGTISSRAAEVKAVRSTNTQVLLSFNGSGGV